MRRRIFASLAKSGYTAKDYVQDGLIAMWDGIENAGWGVHDPNATVWKDLIGTCDAELTSRGSWGDDCLKCNGLSAVAENSLSETPKTIEIVVEIFNRERENQLFWSSGIDSENLYYAAGVLTSFRGFLAYKNCFNVNYDGQVHSISWMDDTSIYVDGSEKRSIGQNGWSISSYRGHVVCFGAFLTGHTAGPYFTGKIKTLRCYNNVITPTDVDHNYAIDKARFNLPDAA